MHRSPGVKTAPAFLINNALMSRSLNDSSEIPQFSLNYDQAEVFFRLLPVPGNPVQMFSHRQTLALPAISNDKSPGRKRKDPRPRSRCHHDGPHANKFIPEEVGKKNRRRNLNSGGAKNIRLVQVTI